MFKKVIEAIEKYDRIIIHRHSNPDGDAIGSQVGLKNILAIKMDIRWQNASPNHP